MLRKTAFYFTILSLFLASCAPSGNQERKYDTTAIENLDKMSEKIGELSSCSYTLNVNLNKLNDAGELSNFSNTNDVYMQAPDKFYMHSVGTKGKKSFWYNGSRFSYFSFEKNSFDTLSVQGNILEAMDFLHHKFGLDFPAADFFYPSLTDDIMDNYYEVLSLNDENIEGVDYLLIQALNKEKSMEIWMEKDTYLPYMLSVISLDDSGISYEAIFSNWRVDPQLSDMLFDYEPAENTNRELLNAKK
ncbi:MAG: DUF2092 domain-containing protein [Bacteroidales bacterium]|nr:DUF2092 domain-containing protein [Bacteroidales bacterium]